MQKSILGPKRIFGYLDEDDLKNEIWVICLDRLKEYNGDRGKLEHFLRVSVKNRLINRYKDITKLVRSPCPRCPFYDPGNSPSDCYKHGDNRELCKKWKNYQLSKSSRNSLLNATEQIIDRVLDTQYLHDISISEIKKILLNNLSGVFKQDFELLLDGYKLTKKRIVKLKEEVDRIMFEWKHKDDGFTQLTIRGEQCHKSEKQIQKKPG